MTTPTTGLAAMHSRMAAHVADGVAPGLVTAVARGGDVDVDAIGRSAFDGEPDSRPMGPDTLFRITSMTKPVVAVATLLLVEDGTLRLDEPVDDLLPELADRRVLTDPAGPLDDTVPAGRAITVEDLLSYRAGFGFDLDVGFPASPYYAAAAELGLAIGPPVPGSPHSPDEWLRGLGTLPLLAQPGARWLYDTCADVLGVLVARAAGAPLPDVLDHHVLRPLGMVDTAFHVAGPDAGRLAACYADDASGGAARFDDGGQWTRPPAFPAGSCGLLSTAGDYVRFATALAAGDLLSPTTVARMTTDRLTGAQHGSMLLGDRGWGLGVAVDPAGRYGWDGGFGTTWFTDPATGGVAVLLTQRMFCEPLMRLMGEFRDDATALFGR
ncbi:serine hydrolase [Pseudonocardia sp. N23]|uniref:serine hydrolase domain-containing protein n=1 Tax=Pseudonocardia sp. N23 TaxID=1987376 RepID=UPI000C02AD01|nr:serine hydrolase domain-containing protein [Pseudonocardia sp. N23]GAY07438.1 beta-lactamase class C and other penicillin binding protein [Pseudonocardia sp. N23]